MKETKDLSSEKNKINICSKILYFVVLITKIFSYFCLLLVAIVMIVLPIITSHIKVTDNTIKVYDEKIEFDLKKVDFLTITVNDKKYVINTENVGIMELKQILQNLTKNLTYKIELILLLTIINIFIICLMLGRLSKLLKNIYQKDTPFSDENPRYIRSILVISIIYIIYQVVATILVGIILNIKISMTFNVFTLFILLAWLLLSSIFEYGFKLENSKKKKN